MPLYKYSCLDCEIEFERISSFRNRKLVCCPECGSLENKILVSRTSFSLKGSRWYKDGYSSKPNE